MSAPKFEMNEKVAVVTGGSKGLGLAMAKAFAEAGASVVIASRKLAACEAASEEITSATGARCLPLACHVGNWDQCDALVESTMAELGRIDVLVNNAGIAPAAPRLIDVSEELFDKTIGVNLKGPLRLSAAAAEHMQAGSTIVNISSVASVRPVSYVAAYSAAKAGLNALTSAMAQEFAPRGIRANAIICGTFMTDTFRRSIPTEELARAAAKNCVLGRIADPSEIVGAALYLATDASSYVTGQTITVDGGILP